MLGRFVAALLLNAENQHCQSQARRYANLTSMMVPDATASLGEGIAAPDILLCVVFVDLQLLAMGYIWKLSYRHVVIVKRAHAKLSHIFRLSPFKAVSRPGHMRIAKEF